MEGGTRATHRGQEGLQTPLAPTVPLKLVRIVTGFSLTFATSPINKEIIIFLKTEA